VGVLWVTCRPSCVVGPLAASDGGTSRDGAPAGSAAGKPAQAGCTTEEAAMHPTQHSPTSQSPGSGSADLVNRRQLEKTVSWTGPERLRCLWYRLRLTVAEMNYATRRVVEVQARWIAGDRPR
jgi:hypothetical protein